MSIVFQHVLRRRHLGVLPRNFAHIRQQLLTPEQENVLEQWAIYHSNIGAPLHKASIHHKVELLCGKKPSDSWIAAYLKRHPAIALGRPSGLDPKRGQAFNRPVVSHHCELLSKLIDEWVSPILFQLVPC